MLGSWGATKGKCVVFIRIEDTRRQFRTSDTPGKAFAESEDGYFDVR